MGQRFANRPRWFHIVVSLLIIASIVAVYQTIFSFSQLRALSAPPAPKSGHPAENAAFRRLRQLDANGFIPLDGPTKAAQQIQAMRAAGPAALAPVHGPRSGRATSAGVSARSSSTRRPQRQCGLAV